jgi:hypothetical protein
MTTKTSRLAITIVTLLEKGTKGPQDAIGIIDEVIGILAVNSGDETYPKASDTVFHWNNETFRVETKVSRVTN